jgi:hypothetical protein
MTTYDGTDTFKGQTVTGDRLDVAIPWHGTTLPTAGSSEVPANGWFFKTDVGEWYENTGTLATPSWTIRSSGITTSGAVNDIAIHDGTSWVARGMGFGDGSDGDATNPTSPSVSVLNYHDLTFSSNRTWTMTNLAPLVIFVSGTLTINGSITWTINPTDQAGNAGSGGSGGGFNSGNGGAGGEGVTVIIIAKTISAGTSAKITVNGVNASNGTNGSTPSSNASGNAGSSPSFPSTMIYESFTAPDFGSGGNTSGAIDGGIAGVPSYSTGQFDGTVRSIHHIIGHLVTGGSGGGEGSETNGAPANVGGGGGGAGGITVFSAGGAGGNGGYDSSWPHSGGGGGGGGGAATGVLVTRTADSDLTFEVVGGNGGNGGNATANGGDGGGGGGGAAACIIISDADTMTKTSTGGSGGTAGSGNGTEIVAAQNGSAGTGTSRYLNIEEITMT